MGRPSKVGQGIYVRLPDEEVEALDQWVKEIQAENPGLMSGITRSDLIRDIVMAATRARREGKSDRSKG